MCSRFSHRLFTSIYFVLSFWFICFLFLSFTFFFPPPLLHIHYNIRVIWDQFTFSTIQRFPTKFTSHKRLTILFISMVRLKYTAKSMSAWDFHTISIQWQIQNKFPLSNSFHILLDSAYFWFVWIRFYFLLSNGN